MTKILIAVLRMTVSSHKIMHNEQGFLFSISGSSTIKWLSGIFCGLEMSCSEISGCIGSSRATSRESLRSSNDFVFRLA